MALPIVRRLVGNVLVSQWHRLVCCRVIREHRIQSSPRPHPSSLYAMIEVVHADYLDQTTNNYVDVARFAAGSNG
jgi:hypothetical protein